MNPNIFEEVEKMSEQDKKALLDTQFPEEIEKEAAAELDSALLADALYSYGWLQGERAIAEVDGLDKVAAEALAAHEAAEAEVSEQIEACLTSLGTHQTEDVVDLHKEAQAAAALIFNGYSDCMEKNAKAGAGMLAKVKGAMKSGASKVKAAGKKAGKEAYKHRGKLSAGAGAVAGYGAMKQMNKKASELTAEELIEVASEIALEKAAAEVTIQEGIEVLEKLATAKAGKLKALYSGAKKQAILHRGKVGGLLGAAGGAAAAAHAAKKD